MEKLILLFNLGVERIRGKDEYEIYKNYINDLPRERIAHCLNTYFQQGPLETKDDFKAAKARTRGNTAFVNKDYKKSLKFYTKSLRYATYNGDEYALALANRSAVYLILDDYQSCIEDINLCLQANYPDHLQPKVYVRKARCFQKLGNSIEMRRTLVDALNVIDGLQSKFNTATEKYKETIGDLIIGEVYEKPVPTENFEVLPVLEPNPMFLNASSSIMFKYNKQKGRHVVAKNEIAVGDVLFVEKAYAFCPVQIAKETDADEHCQYCLLKLRSCVPCKACVKHLYCNEKCRDAAWNEFHQWECLTIQAGFHTCCADLPFRIILKTVNRGFSAEVINFQDGVNKYGDKEDNYQYVYNLPSYLDKIPNNSKQLYVAAAALHVNYLKLKTTFFQTMKQLPEYAKKSIKELMTIIGGLIVRHCGQLQFVPVWDYDNDCCVPAELTIANAFCNSMAVMKHSCIPNTGHYFVGDSVVVKAINKIKVDEDISYSYCGVPFNSMEKKEREIFLKKICLMKCKCPLCTDPKMDRYYTCNSFLCLKCKGPTSLVNNSNRFAPQIYVCLYCSYKFELLLNVKNVIHELYTGVNHLFNIEEADRFIALSKTIYSPYHDLIVSLYTRRLEFYRIRGNVKAFMENAMLLIRCLEEKRNGPAVKVGRDSYSYCVTALDMLQSIAKKMYLRDFGYVLQMLTKLVEKSKFVFNLHHARFLARIQPVEKHIRELQNLYDLRKIHG